MPSAKGKQIPPITATQLSDTGDARIQKTIKSLLFLPLNRVFYDFYAR